MRAQVAWGDSRRLSWWGGGRYAQSSGFEEQEVLEQLPPPMAQELINCIYAPVIQSVPMFRCTPNTIITLIETHALARYHIYRVLSILIALTSC